VRVTIAIPAYNSAGFIGGAIESALAQSRPGHEILVIDDGSEDDLEASLAHWDQVTLVRTRKGGVSRARNLGIERASGDCIAFLDADDYWQPDKLERQVAVFERHPEVGLVLGNGFTATSTNGPRKPAFETFAFPTDRPLPPRPREMIALIRSTWTSVVAVRRSVLGGERFAENLRTAEDRDLLIRLLAGHGSFYISDPLATKVEREGSLSNADPSLDYPNMLDVIRRHRPLLGGSGERWSVDVLRGWAASHLARREPGQALPPALRRAFRDFFSPEAWWVVGKSALGAAAAPWRTRARRTARRRR
jgi:glycosyltransferase involved in cell wall biosynthesis